MVRRPETRGEGVSDQPNGDPSYEGAIERLGGYCPPVEEGVDEIPPSVWTHWQVSNPDGTVTHVSDLFPSVAAERGGIDWTNNPPTFAPVRHKWRERARQRVYRIRVRVALWVDPRDDNYDDWGWD